MATVVRPSRDIFRLSRAPFLLLPLRVLCFTILMPQSKVHCYHQYHQSQEQVLLPLVCHADCTSYHHILVIVCRYTIMLERSQPSSITTEHQYLYYNTKSTVVHRHKQMETIVHAIQANPLVHIPFPPSKTQPVFKSSIQRVLRRPLFCSQPFCVEQNCTICPPASDPRNASRLSTPCFRKKISYHP